MPQKLATTIQHRDRDILNLQSAEDLVQDKAELKWAVVYTIKQFHPGSITLRHQFRHHLLYSWQLQSPFIFLCQRA